MNQLQKALLGVVAIALVILIGPYFGLHILSRAPVIDPEPETPLRSTQSATSRSPREKVSQPRSPDEALDRLLDRNNAAPTPAEEVAPRRSGLSELEELLLNE